jgi:sigma-54 dependent transcriptional regulator, acetoin dehydrogenase operon transcriptional activator AcoR
MKRIKVVAKEREALEKYIQNLKYFFNDYAYIDGIIVDEATISKKIDADVIIVSNQIIFNYISSSISNHSQVIYLDVSFYKKDISKLDTIPNGTKVLLVDYREYMAITLAGLLNEFGIHHIDFIPYAPDTDIKFPADINLAISPGLCSLVPDSIEKIIDIGYRKIDISTITRIASRLEINSPQLNEKIIEYSEELCTKNQSITKNLKNLKINQIHIDAILGSIDDGIIINDMYNNIIHCNKYICQLTKKKGCTLDSRSPHMPPICSYLLKMETSENRFISLNEYQKNILVSKKVIDINNNIKNFIISIKDTEKIQNAEIGIRKSLSKKGYLAKYNFSDIVHQSTIMKNTIERAKKIASTDAATLIIGDSGTGKELFAHSIHNNSIRKRNPFLGINCAALSDNLLESELFGYEEGSFTGAKKGGKEGLFELAHSGTIFLDELGSISQKMQVKLLRVLQEREVMRVGGSNLIPVDVRVIAATNENLEELVEKGIFRKDLYYRINSFTVKIPSLKDRKEDIPLFIDTIMLQHNRKKQICKELMDFLINQEWPGNVRELKNCIEYLIFMGSDKLTLDDLPSYIKIEDTKASKPENNNFEELFIEEKDVVERIIQTCSYRSVGRRNLLKLLEQQGYNITEYKLRQILDYLRKKNVIYIKSGRGGIKLVDNCNLHKGERP